MLLQSRMLSRYFAAMVAAGFLAYFAPLAARSTRPSDNAQARSGQAQSIGAGEDARVDSRLVQQRTPARSIRPSENARAHSWPSLQQRTPAGRAQPVPVMEFFEVHEQSILDLQAAQTAGKVTSKGLVDSYLARIQAYDQAGPRLNAIVLINPRAREDAEALDRERADKGPRGPLHGIPVLIKDNYDTTEMPTSGGALAFATMQPVADAFQVR